MLVRGRLGIKAVTRCCLCGEDRKMYSVLTLRPYPHPPFKHLQLVNALVSYGCTPVELLWTACPMSIILIGHDLLKQGWDWSQLDSHSVSLHTRPPVSAHWFEASDSIRVNCTLIQEFSGTAAIVPEIDSSRSGPQTGISFSLISYVVYIHSDVSLSGQMGCLFYSLDHVLIQKCIFFSR